ncbi:MAG TPA: hypothetical protein VEX86_12245 [Longimicrobium sp.]|nr:hypothetical protein [Longimicrobium sp.]
MSDDAEKPPPGLLDRLIRAYQSVLGRPDRPVIPPPPDPAEYAADVSPPTPEERVRAEAAARETMRRLREGR